MLTYPVTVQEIEAAFMQFDGAVRVVSIARYIVQDRKCIGEFPHQYSNWRSYRNTVQKLIEDYCPQSANFKGRPYFERTGYGWYRLI